MDELRVWAPNASRVAVRANGGDTPLTAAQDGWWRGPALPPGTDYGFVLDSAPEALPDPASRWQPQGVHGPSRVYDQSVYTWTDGDWRGRPWHGAVVYELHIGTFTPGGTLASAIEHLDHLVDLGITHLELLPVNAVNGIWNWGYDGVGWYAVHEPYCRDADASDAADAEVASGSPDALKRFVDAAHSRGLAVLLDVVYNHLGPSGNYLPRFGPYLTTGQNTWGDLINVEEPAVRRFVIDNALMWVRDFHVDGLRLDAVHAIRDNSSRHVLAELAEEVHAYAEQTGRTITLIAESDLNDAQQVLDEWGLDAQWNDDVHHALHVALTGETQGYYADFEPTDVLAKVFTDAFLHDGSWSSFRGRLHGRPIEPDRHSGSSFVVCLQNHDQVGNRAVGDRLPELTTAALLRVGAVLLLTSPFTPMLWMGEEWAASTRWPFFTSHPEPELAAAVGGGRLREFAQHGWDVSAMIDPQHPRAYTDAVLRWEEVVEPEHLHTLRLYRRLIQLRAGEPELRDGDLRAVTAAVDEAKKTVVIHRGSFRVAANLSDREVALPLTGEVVLETAAVETFPDELRLPAQSAVIIRGR